MIQLAGQFVPVKLNAEKEGAAPSKRYGVIAWPTLLFLDPSGAVVGKIRGYYPPVPFAQRMTEIEERWRSFPVMQARLKANPKDVEAAAKLAASCIERGNAERALQLLAQAEKSDPKNARGHLAPAYNAIGDYFQARRELDRALPYFRKAAATGMTPYDIAYARMSIGACYISQDKPQAAIPELEATLAIAGAPEAIQKEVQELLEGARKQVGAGAPAPTPPPTPPK